MKTGLNDKLAFEIQKRHLPFEMKDKELALQQREIENLREQVLQLKEINALLKNQGDKSC